MNIVAVIGILASLCAVGTGMHCDELPWIRDVNLIEFSHMFSGRYFVYKTLDKNLDVCSTGYIEFLRYTNLITFRSPKGCNGDAQYEYDCYTDGIYDRLNLQTGEWEERRVYYASGGDKGGSICLYTCRGHEAKNFDCYTTSQEYTEKADLAINETGLALPFFECKELPPTTIPLGNKGMHNP